MKRTRKAKRYQGDTARFVPQTSKFSYSHGEIMALMFFFVVAADENAATVKSRATVNPPLLAQNSPKGRLVILALTVLPFQFMAK
jgi:hypothetical protein